MIEKKGCLTALNKLSNYIVTFWQSSKVFQVLASVVTVSLVAGGTFVSLKEFEKRKTKVFAASNTLQIELPKGVKKQDLQNLTPEQQEKLDQQINAKIKAQIKNQSQPQNEQIITIVVLTQNGQPILPDLNQGTGGTTQEVVPTATPTPVSRQEPSPTSTPTAAPTPPCTDTDGGKDYFTKGTVTTSYGDKKTDLCTDPNIVGEYSCIPGALFAFDGFICPGKCTGGACEETVGCVDSDGGKNYYTFGQVNTGKDVYKDFCFSTVTGQKVESCTDNCYLNESYCYGSRVSHSHFVCPNGCSQGICVGPPPTTPPTIVLSPTITPTPTNVPCTDTDGGKDIYTKGTVNTWGKYYTDTCYSLQSGDKTECSDYFCRLLEYSCQPQGYQGEGFTCQYGCKDGACIKTPPTATPTPTKVPTSTPWPTNTPAPSPTVTPTPTPSENNLTFVFEGNIKQKYKELKNRELKDDVNKIYEAVKKIYGPPYKSNTVKIKSAENSFYNASLNEINISPLVINAEYVLTLGIVAAFHDDIAIFIPDIWEGGLQNIVTKEVLVDLFEPEKKNTPRFNYPFYELVAYSPGLISNNGNYYAINDASNLDTMTLLSATLYKPFIEDNQFYVNFNKELYKQTLDESLKGKVFAIAASVKPTIEGVSASEWLANQYILQIKPIAGKFIIPFVKKNHNGKMAIYAKAVEVLNNGDRKYPANKTLSINAYDVNNLNIWSQVFGTSEYGEIGFGEMLDAAGFTGNIRFDINIPGFRAITFYYPYWDGQPMTTEASPPLGVFGSVVNGEDGRLDLELSSHFLLSIGSIGHGSFSSSSEQRFYNTKGIVEVSFMGDRQNPAYVDGKTITKDIGDYYLYLILPDAASRQTRGSPPAPGSGNCTEGWTDYANEDFGLKFKIPSGWTDNSVDEHQSETFIYRHLISTTIPEQQLDPKYKISYFEILVSTSDLKNSDYGAWLENNTGNQQKTPVDFKGIAAEKYIDDTQMPCVSQTEEGTACDYHSEIYYFEKDDIYYLLSLGIYTSADVKEQNETNLKCFLENFELAGQEETVGGMKLFTSQRLQFKIRYPAELFVHEWPSSYKPNFNGEKPDSDRNMVQFFKNKDLRGDKITIRRDTNSQRKTAKDFAKAYWSASEESLKHWKPKNIDFVVYSVKVQGSNEEEKTYFTPLGDWMYIFDSSETRGLQSALEKMLPTLEFLGSGTETFSDLIPCPDDLLSTSEQLKEQQEDWWTKPDRCDSRPEKKVCGYIRSIYDNGVIQVGSQEYRNTYCYCSFFEKSGSRVFRGTEMFSLGYKEGACKEKI